MAPRPKKRNTPEVKAVSNAFIEALKFCSCVTKEAGPPNETHVRLQNGWVTAFNGVLGAGCKIAEDIFAAPNNKLMIEALSKCGENLSITQLDNNRLAIKSDKFTAIVPCIDPILAEPAMPDAPIADVNDHFKTAIEAVGVLANESAERIELASVLLKSGSVIATTGTVLFEYWHGIDMPTLAIPKSLVQNLTKCSKKLVRFGFSQNSITFYFEDESWMKSQLYAKQWPDIEHILQFEANPWNLPNDFYKALDAVAPFSENGLVYFDKNILRSHSEDGAGATYELDGLPKGLSFSIKQLYTIKPHVEKIDWFAKGKFPQTAFYGKNIRGLIAGMTRPMELTPYKPVINPSTLKNLDDDIPF